MQCSKPMCKGAGGGIHKAGVRGGVPMSRDVGWRVHEVGMTYGVSMRQGFRVKGFMRQGYRGGMSMK